MILCQLTLHTQSHDIIIYDIQHIYVHLNVELCSTTMNVIDMEAS